MSNFTRISAALLAMSLSIPAIAQLPDEAIHDLKSYSGIGTVTSISDQNTLHVAYPDGQAVSVALLGVDIPQPKLRHLSNLSLLGMQTVSGLSEAEGSKRLRAVGAGAVRFLELQLLRQKVRLEFPNQHSKDSQGRLRAFVFRARDGLAINAELVAQGLAFIDVYVTHPYSHAMENAQIRAYNRDANLWAKAGQTQISFYRTTSR